MWYLTLHRWIGDPSIAISQLLDKHLGWMQSQQLEGKVLIAGPTPDHQLGIIVFGHMAEAALHDLCRHEPFIEAGYRTYEVIPWDVHHLLGVGGFSRSAVAAMAEEVRPSPEAEDASQNVRAATAVPG